MAHKSALRALKRRISDALYAQLITDQQPTTREADQDPGGQSGNDSASSAAGSQRREKPALRISHSRADTPHSRTSHAPTKPVLTLALLLLGPTQPKRSRSQAGAPAVTATRTRAATSLPPVSTGHTFRRRSKAIYASTLDTVGLDMVAGRLVDAIALGAPDLLNLARAGRAGAGSARGPAAAGQSQPASSRPQSCPSRS
jgi:hypothetical protein